MTKKMNYLGCFEVPLKKIEVYSFSNNAVPYYHIDLNGKATIVGGQRMGSLKELEMDDPIIEARNWEYFLGSLMIAASSGTDYKATQLHKIVAEMDCDDNVLDDVYQNAETGQQFIALGASNILYIKHNDGNIGFMFAG